MKNYIENVEAKNYLRHVENHIQETKYSIWWLHTLPIHSLNRETINFNNNLALVIEEEGISSNGTS